MFVCWMVKYGSALICKYYICETLTWQNFIGIATDRLGNQITVQLLNEK